MALVFYCMPILCENYKPRLLYYLKRRGYRGYSMNRPDKIYNKLSVTEKEIGGIPNSSEDIKQAHAAAIESYIETAVGFNGDSYGNIYFHFFLASFRSRIRRSQSVLNLVILLQIQRHFLRYQAPIRGHFISLKFLSTIRSEKYLVFHLIWLQNWVYEGQ